MDCILDGGPCRVGIESTILDLSGAHPQLLRPGAISAAAIERVLGQPLAEVSRAVPRVPGALPSHYAPQTPLVLVAPYDLQAEVKRCLERGERVAVLARSTATPLTNCVWQTMPSDASDYAHELYARLRALDALHVDHLLIEVLPAEVMWLAVRDRLARAAQAQPDRSKGDADE